MKPLFFNPHDGRGSPCGEVSLGAYYPFIPEHLLPHFNLREASERYVLNAPYGAGVAGGSAVASELLTRRHVGEIVKGPELVSQVTHEEPGKRVVVTTQTVEIVTVVTTFMSTVSTGGGRSPERAQPKASE